MADRWGRRLFVVGAAALLLLGAVHSLSLFERLTPANDTEKQLLDLMTNYKFNLMGSMRSMSDLMRGFSITFMLGALGFGAFDLVLRRERAELLRRVALVNVLWLVALTAVSLRYFFLVPTAFLLATVLIFALAWLKLPVQRTT